MSASVRTQLRDGLVTALENMRKAGQARIEEFAVSLTYDQLEDCKQWPTYCVIVTDETAGPHTLRERSCIVSAMTVLYVQHAKDPRAELDRAIEDVYGAVSAWATDHRDLFFLWKLSGITTDEGTRIAKPHAQAVLRWEFTHSRNLGSSA